MMQSRGLAAVAATCVAFLAVNWQGSGRWVLDFVNCDIMEDTPVDLWPCGPHPLVPSLWTQYFYPAISTRALEVQKERLPVILHIGASEFEHDRIMYNHLLNQLMAHGVLPELVLVEPQTQLIPNMTKKAKELPIEDRLQVINRAVDPGCTGEPLKMYAWSNKIQEHFTRHVPILHHHVTSNRETILAAAKGSAKDSHNPYGPDWARVCDWPNLTDYVEEVAFQCENVSGLLSLVGARARDIAFLIVDAEGMDCAILKEFLGLEGFAPAFIMLEIHMRDACFFRSLWPAFRSRGYLIGTTNGGCNIVAVDSRLYRMPVLQRVLQWFKPLVPCSPDFCHNDHLV